MIYTDLTQIVLFRRARSPEHLCTDLLRQAHGCLTYAA